MPLWLVAPKGTKGLGLVVVERFLTRGFAVTVLSRNPSDRHFGNPRIRHLAVDLENPQEIQGIWMQACAQVGPVRYLALCQRFRGASDSSRLRRLKREFLLSRSSSPRRSRPPFEGVALC
jgi:NAD(P)-dependent dehydrogenase (short-subunit alcohol dehydrogenase family)